MGWASLDAAGACAGIGCWEAKKHHTFETRRAELRTQLHAGIAEAVRHGCTCVAVEEPWGPETKGQRAVLAMKTMIEEAAVAAGIIYETVHPSQWKSLVRSAWGQRLDAKASKRIGRMLAERRVGPWLSQQGRGAGLREDEADAYWIARTLWQRVTGATRELA